MQDEKINCPNACSAYYPFNSIVTLTAKPTSITQFAGWSGDCTGNNLTCTLLMNGTKNVIAKFTGQVAGITTCGIYMTKYIKYGVQNDPEEVKKLQVFLNQEMGANLPITGVYDRETMEWVNKFQLKYKEEILRPWVEAGIHSSENIPTGYVYKTTLRWINMIMCPQLNLPMPDLSEDKAKFVAAIEEIPSQTPESSPLPSEFPSSESPTPEIPTPLQSPSQSPLEVGQAPPKEISPEVLQASLWQTLKNSSWFWVLFWVLIVLLIAGGVYYVLKKIKKRPTP